MMRTMGMRRQRRFPLLSVIIAVAIVCAIIYLTFIDVDVPRRALSQVGEAISQMGKTLSLVIGGDGSEFQFLRPTPLSGAGEAQGGQQSAATPLLVNASNPIPEGYAPKDLVRMLDYCDESVAAIKDGSMEGNREAVIALVTMLRAAIEQGMRNWQISEGYRSVAYQQQLWDSRVAEYREQGLSEEDAQTATAKYVAKPGTSEHHTGLAFDLTVPGESFPLTEQSKWLAANCWDYGFIIRYTEEKQPITGINAEPWHIRYVGQPHARNMHDSGQSLEEYLGTVGRSE